jgi:hypothetical protein
MQTKTIIYMWIALFSLAATAQVAETNSESDVRPLFSPDPIENQIARDREANPFYE